MSLILQTQETLYIGLELIKKYSLSADKVFDAYLAATALGNDIKVIATDNTKDFKVFKGIELLNPFVKVG